MRHVLQVEPWLVPHVPRHGKVALDVGANVGYWTTDLSANFSRVHSFEPNPECLKLLSRHIADGDVDNVTLWPALAGQSMRPERPFYVYENHVHGTVFGNADSALNTCARGEPAKCIQVPQVSLDGLRIERADFIKIDVEGAEYEVLLGASLVARSRPTWLIEIHSEENRELCARWLRTREFDVTAIPHPHGPFPGHLWLLAK